MKAGLCMDSFLKRAFELAKRANPSPNPQVGAVVVKDGEIVGEGWHKKAGGPHAEVVALEEAGRDAQGATLYVSLEPCAHFGKTPPCTYFIKRSGIKRVVFGLSDDPISGGADELRESGMEVEGPFKTRPLPPQITVKMAASLDGKSATYTGDSKWITPLEVRRLVHKLRAVFDAVVVGANTVKKDDPELTAHGMGKDPVKVILDSDFCINPRARVFKKGRVVIASPRPSPSSYPAEVISFTSLKQLVALLRERVGERILIEGGNSVNASFFREGLVDRFIVFISPKLIGGDGLPLIGPLGIKKIAQCEEFEIKKIRFFKRHVVLDCYR